MVIRMRHTRAHTKNRRSHHGLEAPTLSACTQCEAFHRPHHMCQECGFYKGRMVIDMKAKSDKREARMTAKKEAIKGLATAEAEEGMDSEMPAGDVAPDQVAAGKAKTIAAPEMATEKSAAPRKHQGS